MGLLSALGRRGMRALRSGEMFGSSAPSRALLSPAERRAAALGHGFIESTEAAPYTGYRDPKFNVSPSSYRHAYELGETDAKNARAMLRALIDELEMTASPDKRRYLLAQARAITENMQRSVATGLEHGS